MGIIECGEGNNCHKRFYLSTRIGPSMVEIGDFFPIDRQVVYTDRASTALGEIIRHEELEDSSIVLPAFICSGALKQIFEKYNIHPTFLDVDKETYHMKSPSRRDLADCSAVLLVHSFGLPADIARWRELCDQHDCILIEDCARSLGARSSGQPVGTNGEYAIYSLYKVSPTTRGGCLVHSKSNLNIRLERAQYDVRALYSLTPLRLREKISKLYADLVGEGAGSLNIGLDQPRRLDRINQLVFQYYIHHRLESQIQRNRKRSELLRACLKDTGIDFQPDSKTRVHFTTPGVVPSRRDELAKYLSEKGFSVSTHWKQPFSKSTGNFQSDYPNTANLSDSIIHFNTAEMNQRKIRRLCSSVKQFYG